MEILCMLLWSFGIVFSFCEVAQVCTDEFEHLNDELHQCSWYLYPIKLQRALVIVMSNAQMPMIIRGFANSSCTRESFRQVINLIFTKFHCQKSQFHCLCVCLCFFIYFSSDISCQLLLLYGVASNRCLKHNA